MSTITLFMIYRRFFFSFYYAFSSEDCCMGDKVIALRVWAMQPYPNSPVHSLENELEKFEKSGLVKIYFLFAQTHLSDWRVVHVCSERVILSPHFGSSYCKHACIHPIAKLKSSNMVQLLIIFFFPQNYLTTIQEKNKYIPLESLVNIYWLNNMNLHPITLEKSK